MFHWCWILFIHVYNRQRKGIALEFQQRKKQYTIICCHPLYTYTHTYSHTHSHTCTIHVLHCLASHVCKSKNCMHKQHHRFRTQKCIYLPLSIETGNWKSWSKSAGVRFQNSGKRTPAQRVKIDQGRQTKLQVIISGDHKLVNAMGERERERAGIPTKKKTIYDNMLSSPLHIHTYILPHTLTHMHDSRASLLGFTCMQEQELHAQTTPPFSNSKVHILASQHWDWVPSTCPLAVASEKS